MLSIVKTKLQNILQIETIGLIEANRLGKLIKNKERLIRFKVISTKQKYNILSKTSSLKGSGIFINEYLILEDQTELRKEEKLALIRNMKASIRDRNPKDSNK